MKSFRFAVTGAASLMLAIAWVGIADAQVPVPGQVEGVQPLPPPVGASPLLGGGDLISAKGLEKLALSKEQKADYDKLNEEFKKKQKDSLPNLIDLTSDPAKVKESFEAQKKLRPDYLAKVEKLLTDEQKATYQEVRRESGGPGGQPFLTPTPLFPGGGFGGGPSQFLPADVQKKLKLTDDQKKKVDELQKELEAKILGLLTDEQKTDLENLKKQGSRPNPLQINPGELKPVPPVPPKLTPGDPKSPAIPEPKKLIPGDPKSPAAPKLVPPDLSKQLEAAPPRVEVGRPELNRTEK